MLFFSPKLWAPMQMGALFFYCSSVSAMGMDPNCFMKSLSANGKLAFLSTAIPTERGGRDGDTFNSKSVPSLSRRSAYWRGMQPIPMPRSTSCFINPQLSTSIAGEKSTPRLSPK